jgi:pyruvate formate lyase activating enzyme
VTGPSAADDPAAELAVAGLTRLSSCDWPGQLVATVFLQGCPWDCVYCHNPDLIDPRRPGTIPWDDVLAFLADRRGLLDGLVFSGGEPTRQDLTGAVAQVRALGFKVGLHTMGAYPSRLARLLPLLDWVGFDVKAAPGRLESIVRRPGAGRTMARSLDLLLASGVDHQLRTTWGPGVQTAAEAAAAQDWVSRRGGGQVVLQPVRPDGARPEFVQRFQAIRGGPRTTVSPDLGMTTTVDAAPGTAGIARRRLDQD